MIALMLAAALAGVSDPPWILRPEDTIGRPYRPAPPPPEVQLGLQIESPTANPRWTYRIRYWNQEPRRGYYVERDYSDELHDRPLMISSRECPELQTVLREVPRLRLAAFHIEGFSPPVATPNSNHWRFRIAGSAEHPGGQGGELVAETWQVDGAAADPIARWGRAFSRAFETCAADRGRPIQD